MTSQWNMKKKLPVQIFWMLLPLFCNKKIMYSDTYLSTDFSNPSRWWQFSLQSSSAFLDFVCWEDLWDRIVTQLSSVGTLSATFHYFLIECLSRSKYHSSKKIPSSEVSVFGRSLRGRLSPSQNTNKNIFIRWKSWLS